MGDITQNRPSRFRQWSLRSLLAVMAAVAILLTLVMAPARRQRMAVSEIKRLGGAVYYDYEFRDEQPGWAPVWAIDLLGIDYFAGVERVDIPYRPVGDEAAEFVAQLPRVHELSFDGAGLTDEGLAKLRDLTELRQLHLHACPITDDGLVHLEKLTNLEHLNLHSTWVTDAGLKHLMHLKRLQWLGPPIGPNRGATFEGLRAFARDMPHIRNLQNLKPEQFHSSAR